MARTPRTRLLFTATYIAPELETELNSKIRAMGGEYRHKMSSEVGFLIVGRRFTDKYNFAVCNNIALLAPQRVFEVYEKWVSGEKIDPSVALSALVLRPLEGLLVCTSGLDAVQKLAAKEIVEAAGGVYSRYLTAQCSVVVSPVDSGKKVVGARLWNIPVVHVEWLQHSIKFGQAIDPSRYAIENPDAPRTPPERSNDSSDSATKQDTESNNETEINSTKAGSKDTTGNFGSISSTNRDENGATSRSASVVGTNPDGSRSLTIKRKRHSADLFSRKDRAPSVTPAAPVLSPVKKRNKALFENISFNLYRFTNKQVSILTKTINSHGGTVSDTDFDYIIVSSVSPQHPELSINNKNAKIITEWALERSLHYRKTMLDDMWSRPVWIQPVKNSKNMRVSVSGFQGIELRHVVELIKLLGCVYMDTFTAERDVLVVQSTECRKAPYAIKWKVPMAHMNWLWDCASAGEMISVHADDEHRQAAVNGMNNKVIGVDTSNPPSIFQRAPKLKPITSSVSSLSSTAESFRPSLRDPIRPIGSASSADPTDNLTKYTPVHASAPVFPDNHGPSKATRTNTTGSMSSDPGTVSAHRVNSAPLLPFESSQQDLSYDDEDAKHRAQVLLQLAD